MNNLKLMTAADHLILRDENLMLRSGVRIEPLHTRELMHALLQGIELPPVIVWRRGEELVLLDGHHRMAARAAAAEKLREKDKRFGPNDARSGLLRKLRKAAVRVVEGDRDEALVWMIADNTQGKLGVTQADRLQHAYRMVLETGLSRARLAEATGVGERSISNMRKRREDLKAAGREPTGMWSLDRRDDDDGRPRGHAPEITPEQIRMGSRAVYAAIGAALHLNENAAYEMIAQALGRRFTEHCVEYLGTALNPDF